MINFKRTVSTHIFGCLLGISLNAFADDGAATPRGSSYSYSQEELKQILFELQDKDDQTRAYEAVVSLFWDNEHITEVLGRISNDGTPPKFQYHDLLKFLNDRVKPELLERLGEEQDFQGWVSVCSLERYAPKFSQDDLTLHFTTPPEDNKQKTIDFRGENTCDLSKAVQPEKYSAFLNFYHQAIYTEQQDLYYVLNMEGATRFDPWAAESNFIIDPGAEQSKILTYNNLRFIRDYPKELRRLTIGETQSYRPRLLTSDRMQGVQLSTDYDLQPRLVSDPIAEYKFFLQRPSTVEVWVNEEHVETLRLSPGPYDVQNFPLKIGFNKVRLKITDDLGREQNLSFDNIKGPNLLGKGKEEYTYAAGVVGQGDLYNGDPIYGYFYRRGLSDQLTASLESRGSPDNLGIGVGTDFATKWAFGSLDAGLSSSSPGIGGATRFILSRNFKNFSASYRFDYHQRDFLAQNQTLWDLRIRLMQEFAVTVPRLGEWGSLRLLAQDICRWAACNPCDAHQRVEDITWSYTITDRWSVQAIATHNHFCNPEWDVRGIITYTYTGEKFSQRHDLRIGREAAVLYDTFTGNPRYSKYNDWSLYHSHNSPWDGRGSDNVRGTYRYRHCRFNTYYTMEIGNFGDDNNFKHTLAFNTAIAYTGGRFAWGQPVLNSFALIAPDDKLGDLCIKGTYCGETVTGTNTMPAMISTLKPYWPGCIEVEAEDEKVVLDQPPFTVLPRHKSGFLLIAHNREGEGGSAAIRGVLMDIKGEPLAYQAIVMSNQKDPKATPVVSFTNASGVFTAIGTTPGASYDVWIGNLGTTFNVSKNLHYAIVVPAQGSQHEIDLGSLNPTNSEAIAANLKQNAIPAIPLERVEASTPTPPPQQPLDAPAKLRLLKTLHHELRGEERQLARQIQVYYEYLSDLDEDSSYDIKGAEQAVEAMEIFERAKIECRHDRAAVEKALIDLTTFDENSLSPSIDVILKELAALPMTTQEVDKMTPAEFSVDYLLDPASQDLFTLQRLKRYQNAAGPWARQGR